VDDVSVRLQKIHTYVQKLHMIAKQAFSDWRDLNSPHGRFASENSKTKTS
jgi:hypothetical protein